MLSCSGVLPCTILYTVLDVALFAGIPYLLECSVNQFSSECSVLCECSLDIVASVLLWKHLNSYQLLNAVSIALDSMGCIGIGSARAHALQALE